MKIIIFALLLIPVLTFGKSAMERRKELLNNPSVEVLYRGANDENALIRRTAIRLLSKRSDSVETLKKLLVSKDPAVRRLALQGLSLQNAASDEILDRMSTDPDNDVRNMVISLLAAERPAKGRKLAILTRISNTEKNTALRTAASEAAWPFYRDTVLLRNRTDWDYPVTVIKDIPLPKDNWAFTTDPHANGHFKDYFKTNFNDKSWKRIQICATWESAGFNYDGIAWYRKTFKAPAAPQQYNAVELHFKAVDESAWVWVNGIYVGQHDLGPTGWQEAFSIDITKEIKWGQDNLIVVRVKDVLNAGGIYQPVHLQILK